jgi:hypothetical protein
VVPSSHKRFWILALVAVLALAAGWGFRQVVPWGLRLRSVEPFLFWSRDLGTFRSPCGTSQVRVVVNDAGAMHSGNHWTWVLAPSPLGSRVVAEGYLGSDAAGGQPPLRWVSEREVEVTFLQGRHSGVGVTRSVRVP